jgi:hypothetical protein
MYESLVNAYLSYIGQIRQSVRFKKYNLEF